MGITNKLQKFELAVQKSTELGVTEIVPVVCRRSSNAHNVKNWEGKLKRWRDIVVNAAKQCGRNVLPVVHEPIQLKDVKPETDLSFVLWEKGGKSFKDFASYNASSVSFLVGPEGGPEKEEIDLLVEAGFKPIYLGKRILRAETAAIAGMALVQFLWGDLA